MSTPLQILKKYWGYETFRPFQEEIINSILEANDTVALLPTGAGKSLCYQVPALKKKGVCLVISPLIALMQDQVGRLKELGIRAEAIHAGMHFNDVKRILENTIHDGYKLLYISPERLQTDLFRQYLPAFDISFIAVDEAHCISQWGHDFRPDYLKIAELKQAFRHRPILALTASATTDVVQDICRQLELPAPAIFRQSFERSNIYYDVAYTENKNNALQEALQNNAGSGIIYCRSRKQTENLVRYLAQHGKTALAYHAGMPKEKREENQQAWMDGKVQTMIATTAFGMGIDKADVRMVLHYDAPEHLEAYYQETGRAGRDGKNATALAFYNQTDINRLIESTDLQFPPEAYLRQVYQSVAEYLQIPTGTEPYKYFPFELRDFCKKFKLEAVPASHALKLLEQEGLWTLSDAVFNPATAQFLVNREELDQLAETYPDLGAVTLALLRLYGTVFYHPTIIRIAVIAKQLKITADLADQLLQKLDAMGILEYRKPLNTPQLFFHHYRVDSNHLIIDFKRINALKKRHVYRTEHMVHFLQNQQVCRDRLLLQYFNESAGKDCGHCDVCSTKQRTTIKTVVNSQSIIDLVKTAGSLHIAMVDKHFPAAIRIEIITLIRTMVDERKLVLSPDGNISLA